MSIFKPEALATGPTTQYFFASSFDKTPTPLSLERVAGSPLIAFMNLFVALSASSIVFKILGMCSFFRSLLTPPIAFIA